MAELDPQQISPEDPSSQTTATEAAAPAGGKKRSKTAVFYITISLIALLVFAVSVSDSISSVLRKLMSILSPLIIGAVIAYLCDPILEFYEYRIFRKIPKGGLRRGLSLLCTFITALGIVAMVGILIIPQLYESITDLFNNSDKYISNLLVWLRGLLEKLPGGLEEYVDPDEPQKIAELIAKLFGSAEDALSGILAQVQQLITKGDLGGKVWSFLLGLFNAFKNLFIGVFIAFYILSSKKKRVAQIRKFRRAVLSEKADRRLEEIVQLTDHTFGGFIFGKILDSLVIGTLTFVILTIFSISKYNILIATFIGVTNIIPVFGPIIGAIPSFFIVLISSPSKALLFLLLVLIIQQLDGNIIGPKILGDNTGISSLCVIVAISVCGTMWGVPGMLIGVPVFAVVIEIFKRLMEGRLAAKDLPTDTLHYYPADAIGNAEQDIYYEHASLLYKYRHSKFKPAVDRMRTAFFGSSARSDQRKPGKPGKKDKKRKKADKTSSKPSDTDS